MDPFKPYRPKAGLPGRDEAEALAFRAVAFIVADDEQLSRFGQLTGCGAEDLRQRLAEPAFLGAVLDFILGDEPTTIAFAAAAGCAPETLAGLRALLP